MTLSRFAKPSFIIAVAAVVLVLNGSDIRAQSCNPASVGLLLRDEKGALLSEVDVKSIAASLPKEIGDAGVWVGDTSLAADNKTFYWEEQTVFSTGKKTPALMFTNAGTCTMKLSEVTLEHQGKKMRLTFDIEITRETRDRRPIIDLPKFQNGAFRLDLAGWSHDPHTIIPADRWKSVKN